MIRNILKNIRLIAILYVISIFISCDYYSQIHFKNELNYQISINVDTSVESLIQENLLPGEELVFIVPGNINPDIFELKDFFVEIEVLDIESVDGKISYNREELISNDMLKFYSKEEKLYISVIGNGF